MTENILFIIQFLVFFSGIVYNIVKTVKSLMFTELQDVKAEIQKLKKSVEQIKKQYEEVT